MTVTLNPSASCTGSYKICDGDDEGLRRQRP